MTILDLNFDRSVSGNLGGFANALGAPDGTFSTTSGDVGWTHEFGFPEQPAGSAASSMVLDVVLQKQPAETGASSLSGRVFQDGSLIYTIPSVALSAGVHTRSITIPGIRPSGEITVELTGINTGGGQPARRNTPGIDGATLHYDYTEAQGSAFKGWDGAAWQDGFLKMWDGSGWVPANVRRWTGSAWELVP